MKTKLALICAVALALVAVVAAFTGGSHKTLTATAHLDCHTGTLEWSATATPETDTLELHDGDQMLDRFQTVDHHSYAGSVAAVDLGVTHQVTVTASNRETVTVDVPACGIVQASVGTTFTFTAYANPNRIFAAAKTTGSNPGFRAYVTCWNGTVGQGAWQTQPGPFAGSTASCGNQPVDQYGIRYF